MAFGKRSGAPAKKPAVEPPPQPESADVEEAPKKPDLTVVASDQPEAKKEAPKQPAPPPPPANKPTGDPAAEARFAEIKINVFNSLIDTVDLTELAKLETAQVREEITDIVTEIISLRNLLLSAAEKAEAEALHLPFGVPPSVSSNERLLHQVDYIINYDDDLRMPLWVAYRLTEADLRINRERTECFRARWWW